MRLLLALLVLAVLPGCTADEPPRLVLDASQVAADGPWQLVIDQLRPEQSVSLTVTATDGEGVRWSSRAVFTADSSGAVDTRTVAPAGDGSYAGVSASGLLWSLAPASPRPGQEFAWPAVPVEFRVEALPADGDRLTATFRRALTSAVTPPRRRDLTKVADGLVGTWLLPPTAGPPAPAVVLLGGSEGGVPDDAEAAELAARGHPVLLLGYFAAPGLPQKLERVPLEYFRRALEWVRDQPEVDPEAVVVNGASRGGEAALLVGSTYPELVAGVVAAAPSHRVVCGFPDCDDSAWSQAGRPLPYDDGRSQAAGAVIEVERLDGSLLLACGVLDDVWGACESTDAVQRRLSSSGSTVAVTSLRFGEAGHALGRQVANLPRVSDRPTAAAEQAARTELWLAVLTQLAAL